MPRSASRPRSARSARTWSMPPRRVRFALVGAALTAVLALGGCGDAKKDKRDLSSLDAQLTNGSVDPALREAIEAPIASDPDLTGESNRHAVRPADKPLTGALPARLALPDERAEALRLAGGRLMHAPAASKTVVATREPVTLGGTAARQAGPRCAAPDIGYAMQWAQHMPRDFPIYPGAAVTEAAGADNAPCNLRAASFVTPVPKTEVMDFYATLARRGGYSIEHIEQNGADVLGGTRAKDSGAYYIRFADAPGGGTAVDLIAHGGR